MQFGGCRRHRRQCILLTLFLGRVADQTIEINETKFGENYTVGTTQFGQKYTAGTAPPPLVADLMEVLLLVKYGRKLTSLDATVFDESKEV